jgi:replicative DNA helicase Mcm
VTDVETRQLWETYVDTASDELDALGGEYPDRRSFWVDVIDLYDVDERLADALFRSPDAELETAASVVRKRLDDPGPVTVRVENHPGLLGVEDLRARHLGELVSVEGLVRRPRRRARLERAHYRCRHCDGTLTEKRRGLSGPVVAVCPECGTDALTLEEAKSRFQDTQIFDVEPPGDTEGTQSLVAHLDGERAGAVVADEAVVLTGILRPDPEVRTNVFDAVLSAVSVEDATARPREVTTGLDGLIDAHWTEGDRRG